MNQVNQAGYGYQGNPPTMSTPPAASPDIYQCAGAVRPDRGAAEQAVNQVNQAGYGQGPGLSTSDARHFHYVQQPGSIAAGVTSMKQMTVSDVAALAELMVKHGITRIVCDGVVLERPLPPPAGPREEHVPSDWDAFKQMSADKQEAMLYERLQRGAGKVGR